MNKKIFQLAVESKLRPALLVHHWGTVDALTSSEQEELEQLEKFAELIVKECLEQIYSVTIDNPTDDWDQGYDSGLEQAAETIKTHFGV